MSKDHRRKGEGEDEGESAAAEALADPGAKERAHETEHVLGRSAVHDVEIDGEVSRSMRRRCETADDDELDVAVRQARQQAWEIGHFDSGFSRECRTASANRRTEIIFRTRWSGVSFNASRRSDRSTSFLYRSMMSSIDDRARVLLRAVALDQLQESDAIDRQARLNAVSGRWTLLSLDEEIIERARRPFPAEPVRTLDAIHLASALTARKAVPDLAMLTLDGRIRQAADRLGFTLVPADAELGHRGIR